MSTLRLALAQHDFPVGAVAGNAARVRAMIADAKRGDAQLLVCPELAISGYPPEDLLLRGSFLAACRQEVEALAREATGIDIIIGFPHAMDGVFNAAAVLQDGAVTGIAHKQALPNYGVFDDKRYFHPGTASHVCAVRGVRVGVLVCEDIWEPGPARSAAGAGAQLLVVINASPWDRDKQSEREALLAARARETGCAIAYLNMVGGQDEVVYDGASLLVDGDGTIAARAPAFEDVLLFADVDADARQWRAHDWASRETGELAALHAGLVRGIRDYVHKNGFTNVLLGLSGGIDSALVLALAVDALGPRHVRAYMLPSRFTSRLSLDAARIQAGALGVSIESLSIEPAYDALMDTLAPEFAGRAADVTEENLQSRVRGVLLMALSNKLGALLLSTGNKSEMAVGYATLYGDMCGAYAPLKDVYKTQVYAVARWRNALASIPVIPPAVIDRAPSAELRENQTDQDALPPYDVLDAILERFVDGEQSQAEIVAAGFDPGIVRRIASLVLANEFKRRQAAPGPKVTRRSFGRERRYPITSGWRP